MKYRCAITNGDGEVLVSGELDANELSELAVRYGLKREFLAAFIARSDQGQVSNPAGVVLVWQGVAEADR